MRPKPEELKTKAKWARKFFDEVACEGANGCPAREADKKGKGKNPTSGASRIKLRICQRIK